VRQDFTPRPSFAANRQSLAARHDGGNFRPDGHGAIQGGSRELARSLLNYRPEPVPVHRANVSNPIQPVEPFDERSSQQYRTVRRPWHGAGIAVPTHGADHQQHRQCRDPNYKARDIDFNAALQARIKGPAPSRPPPPPRNFAYR
jgi:hypothetical protein